MKRMVSLIPDNAAVTINGNYNVDITQVKMETDMDGLLVDLMLTTGYSITKDSVMQEMFKDLQLR